MPITINGNGSLTGVSVGGLPDGIVDTDMLAANAVATSKIANSNVTAAKLASGAGGKVIQCVTSALTSQHSTTSSSPQYTGHNLVITPTSNSSKILIMNQTSGGNSGSGRSWKLRLRKTIGGTETEIAYMQLGDSSQNSSFAFSHVLYCVQTSPGTSEITYKTYHSTDGSGTAYYSYGDSMMVAWEVAS